MNEEELITAVETSNMESEAQAEIIELILDGSNARESEDLIVLQTSRDDIELKCNVSLDVMAKLKTLMNSQIEDIARDVEDQLTDHYWDALEMAVEKVLMEMDEEQNKIGGEKKR